MEIIGRMRLGPVDPRKFATRLLQAAAAYHLALGAMLAVWPHAWFDGTGLDHPSYPEVVQVLGLVVGLFGLGCALSARDPFHHWPIPLLGWLGKILAPAALLLPAVGSGEARFWAWALPDLLWSLPLGWLLYQIFRHHVGRGSQRQSPLSFPAALRYFRFNGGTSLAAAAEQEPVFLVFLRHFGCSFCRETLLDLARLRPDLEARGFRLAVVHMSDPFNGRAALTRHGLSDLPMISDPACELYSVFGLAQGRLRQLFGPKALWRGLALLRRGLTVGPLQGDGLRLPGVFIVHQGRIVAEFRHRSVADRPDYLALAETALRRIGPPTGRSGWSG